jgi:hypothetical protein
MPKGAWAKRGERSDKQSAKAESREIESLEPDSNATAERVLHPLRVTRRSNSGALGFSGKTGIWLHLDGTIVERKLTFAGRKDQKISERISFNGFNEATSVAGAAEW